MRSLVVGLHVIWGIKPCELFQENGCLVGTLCSHYNKYGIHINVYVVRKLSFEYF